MISACESVIVVRDTTGVSLRPAPTAARFARKSRMTSDSPAGDSSPQKFDPPSVLPDESVPHSESRETSPVPPPREVPVTAGRRVPDDLPPVEVSLAPDPDNVPRREPDDQSWGAPRVKPALFLFLATCLSTFWAGSAGLAAAAIFHPKLVLRIVQANWQEGLTYMCAVMAILVAHEAGHYFLTRRNRIPASFPLFLPMPISPLGTMGAVIAMRGNKADRRQLFDIGIAGPIAGLVIAIPVIIMGIRVAEPSMPVANPDDVVTFHDPLLMQAMIGWLRPEIPGGDIVMNPWIMAGWVGLVVTGLNMLPISQLDGGHVSYTIFGKKAHLFARAFVLVAVFVIIYMELYAWILFVLLVNVMGVDHPPTRDDKVPLGAGRILLGTVSLVLPIFCIPIRAITVGGLVLGW